MRRATKITSSETGSALSIDEIANPITRQTKDYHLIRLAASVQDPDDLIAPESDGACRRFTAMLIEACASRRLIDTQGELFSQIRRYRLVLLRDGWPDFARCNTLRGAIPDAVLLRDTQAAVHALQQDMESWRDFRIGPPDRLGSRRSSQASTGAKTAMWHGGS